MVSRLVRLALLSTASALIATNQSVAVTPAPAPAPASAPASTGGKVIYRIETSRDTAVYAADHPMQSGDLVSFHEYPGGTLVSMRRSEIRRVIVQRLDAVARGPRPGEAVDIGVTGGGAASRVAGGGGSHAPAASAQPGSRKDGTALFNPDRKYQPDIDSKQVPGMNMGYPNSPNDYREGRTLGYPAAPAVQAAPGDPPKMPEPH